MIFRQALSVLALWALAAPAQAQDVTNPTPPNSINGAYNASAPTCTDGHGCWLQTDVNGNLKVVTSGTPSGTQSVTETPSSASTAAVSKSATQSAGSNSVVKSGAGNLYGLTVTIGATSGWVMVFDATALPSNGATDATMVWCFPAISNGTVGGLDKDFFPPISVTTGITLGFSSTACNSLTASTTAFFYGRYK